MSTGGRVPSRWGVGIPESAVEDLGKLGITLEPVTEVWQLPAYTSRLRGRYALLGDVFQSERAKMDLYVAEALREDNLPGIGFISSTNSFLQGVRILGTVGDYVESRGLPKRFTGDVLSLLRELYGDLYETFDDVIRLVADLEAAGGLSVDAVLKLVAHGLAAKDMSLVVGSELARTTPLDMLLQLYPDKESLLDAVGRF